MQRVAKLPSIFCLLNYHNDSSTITVVFIVYFWSTNIEMISSDIMKLMKENSLKSQDSQRPHKFDLDHFIIINVEFNCACAFVCRVLVGIMNIIITLAA